MTRSFVSACLSIAVLLVVGLSCSQFRGEDETTVSGNSTSATVPTSSSSPGDISGSYEITGTNENGAGAYKGSLVVASRGDVYQFTWDTAGKKYDGVGVRTGDTVGVAFASGDNGEGCGVVLYTIGDDGTLDGKAGYWGNNASEKETARQTSGSGLEGSYDVTGTNTQGKPYSGTLDVKASGVGYSFSWSAGVSLKGFGIREGNMATVGIGGAKCGFVSYERKSDGTLQGKWGGYGSTSVGTEVAKKK